MTPDASDREWSLQRFAALDRADDIPAYIAALEAFDAIEQLQELKAIERRRTGIGPGHRVLDVGCGFGLETLRMAARVGASGRAAGLDKSADFIAEARRRAAAAGLTVDFRVGDAETLPYPAETFDAVRAERVLIYLENWKRALDGMRRVLRPGGMISLIEPDFGTTTINLSDRGSVRRAIAHEADTAVAMSWLPGPLLTALRSLGLSDISVDTRVLVFPQSLAHDYFAGLGRRAHEGGTLDDDQLRGWLQELAQLRAARSLFGAIGYFLFTARADASGK